MGNFNRGDSRSSGGGFRNSYGGGGDGNKRFGGGGRDGGRDGGRPTMHRAVCDECGDDCQVPFRPTGEKPIYCSSCFEKQGNSRSSSDRPSRFGSDRNDRRPRFEDKQMHDATCDKCGTDCQVPFRPTAGKPIFCDNCFEKTSSRSGALRDGGNTSKEIKLLSQKMDKLIELLSPTKTVNKKTEKKEDKKVVKSKTIKIPTVKKETKIKEVATKKTTSKKAIAKKVAVKKTAKKKK